jgi:anaerobic selenocysteine-containing dehydrogenase
VADAGHRAELEQAWGLPPGAIDSSPGLAVWQQIEAMEAGALDLWWVAATNPLVSLPDLNRVRSALARCPLVVLSEAYADSETAAAAHLVLPAAQWSEKEGTMTNSERRVTFCPAFRPPPGESRPDWQVFAELAAASAMGTSSPPAPPRPMCIPNSWPSPPAVFATSPASAITSWPRPARSSGHSLQAPRPAGKLGASTAIATSPPPAAGPVFYAMSPWVWRSHPVSAFRSCSRSADTWATGTP